MTIRTIDKLIGLPEYLYPLLAGKNIASFDYIGSEANGIAVRRTIALIEATPTHYIGHEIGRDGVWRTLGESPVKSYSKDRIVREDRYVTRTDQLPDEVVKMELQAKA